MGKRRSRDTRGPAVHWYGDQTAAHSLGLVNHQICSRLVTGGQLRLVAVTGQLPTGDGDERWIRAAAPGHPAVTVRHRWPPDLTRPTHGAWVMVQPWEFGGLPADWIAPMRDEVDEVWAYTNFVRDRYLEAGVDRSRVILLPLGVDASVFAPEGDRFLAAEPGTFRFLFVGGTIPRKGIDVLLAAWVRAFDRTDGVELVIKGSDAAGAYAGSAIHGDLARVRAQHPDAAPIRYLHTDLDVEGVAALYRSCDALVHPYRGEGFGLPVVEAMASGLPVIVTAGGATDDFCNDERAFRLPAERRRLEPAPGLPAPGPDGYWLLEPELDAVIETMRLVHSDRAVAAERAEAGRRWVTEHCSWDQTAAVAAERLVLLGTAVVGTAPGTMPRRSPAAVGTGVPAPLLSACLITKDESELLPACLASLEGLVDEIVVHDTGSTDDTVALARAAGATVVEGRWDDDFGAARNTSLAACRGRWVLHIDADERVAAGTAADALRAALADPATADVLLVTLDNVHADGTSGVRHQAARLFRRERAHWSGRLHEQVVARPGQPALTRADTTDLLLDHLGYQPEVMAARGKADRNVRLAEADLADAPHAERASLLLNLARSLTVADRHPDALERCIEARALGTLNAEVRDAIAHHAAELLVTMGRPAEVAPWLDDLRRAKANEPLVAFLAGTAALLLDEGGPLVEALAALDPDVEIWNDTTGVAVATDLIQQRRALALAATGQWPEAAAAFFALVQGAPAGPLWASLVRAVHEAGLPPAVVADAVLPEHLRHVVTQLLLVTPDAADPVGEALWQRFAADPVLVGFAVHHGPRTDGGRCLEWAARVRAAGLADSCPLLARARRAEVVPNERLRAAAIAHTAFADPRAARLATSLAACLGDDDVLPALVDLDELAPELLPDIVGGLARLPERVDALTSALVALGAVELAEEIRAEVLSSKS